MCAWMNTSVRYFITPCPFCNHAVAPISTEGFECPECGGRLIPATDIEQTGLDRRRARPQIEGDEPEDRAMQGA